MAKLYFTHGTMGAQKTTQLLAAAHNFEEHGGSVLMTKPAIDTRGERELMSRIGLRRAADFLTTPDMDVAAEVLRWREARGRISAVLVDEAQFLQPAQVDQLLALAVLHAIPVMAWGLRTDFRTRSFPGSLRLLEIAHELRESIAMCGHGGGCGCVDAEPLRPPDARSGRGLAAQGRGSAPSSRRCGDGGTCVIRLFNRVAQ